MSITILYRYDTWVKAATGPAISGAQVWVCTQPANVLSSTSPIAPSPLASIFEDSGGLVPITQPLLTDGFGHVDFYAEPGLYTVVVATSSTVQTILEDQSIGNIGTQGGGGGGTASGLTLYTNGVENTVQNTLNLYSSDGSVILTPDSSGDVNLQAQKVSFSGSGAYMLGPGIRNVDWFNQTFSSIQVNGVNGVRTANRVVVYLFQLDVQMTISKVSAMASNNSAGVTSTFGIYSFAGNLLVNGGQFNEATSPAVQTNSITPVTIQPGLYWLAQAVNSNSASATFYGLLPSSTIIAMYFANNTRAAYAANTLSSGVLPSTLGSLTAFTPNSGDGDGFVCPFFE